RKLSKEAEAFSRIQQRINMMRDRVQSRESDLYAYSVRSAERLLDLQNPIFGAEREHFVGSARLKITQKEHALKLQDSELRQSNAQNGVRMQRNNLIKVEAQNLTATEQANLRIAKMEEESIKRRMALRKALEGHGVDRRTAQ